MRFYIWVVTLLFVALSTATRPSILSHPRSLAFSLSSLSIPSSALASTSHPILPRKKGGDDNDHFSSPSSDNDSPQAQGFENEFENEREGEHYRSVHGIIMSIVVLLLFPLGALAMRVLGRWWLHAILQVLSIGLLIAGFGIGVFIAKEEHKLFNNVHTLLGVVLVGLFVTAQPLLGMLQHQFYRKNARRGPQGHAHLWLGRVLMILGVINGGLGLGLVGDDEYESGGVNWRGTYIGVAIGMAVFYVLVVVVTAVLKRRTSKKAVV